MTKSNLKFDKQFFRDFWQLVKPYWTSEEKWSAFTLLALNIVGTIVGVRISVALNDINKNIFDAIQNFNKELLTRSLIYYIVILGALLLVYGYAFYFNGLLSIRWRRWLTKNYLEKWLHNQNHYRMQLHNQNVDNPDQRISEDLEKFPDTTLSVIFMFFQSSLTLLSFGYILWGLSGNLSIPIGSFHIVIPGYLVWGALLCGIFGTLITGWIGKKLASLDYQQQFYNADFRFSLIRLRESSEQIALHQGEPAENDKFNYLFSRIFNNFMNITSLRKRLMFFTSGYNIGAHFIGTLLAIPLYFQKKIQFGGMMQITGAFSSVISGFSMLVNGFSLFAEWRAVVSRLTEFNESMDTAQINQFNIAINKHDCNDIVIENLKLNLPDGKTLINNINLTLHSGTTFLLSGKSGLGKSTFLRALSGLWPYGEGQIQIPKNKKIVFLPQKPYLPLGSLKEALMYPNNQNINDDALHNVLDICELTKFQCRLDEIKNWSQELSLGEQQLIAFARIFLNKPDVIFLDESTSALDERLESKIYESLQKSLPDATIISIGHRSSLHQFHKTIITLASNMNELLIGETKKELAMGT